MILSPSFLAKKWPEYELRGLTAKEMAGGKKVIPIWHNVDRNSVLGFSPPLADKLAIRASQFSPIEIAVAIIEITNPELFQKVHLRKMFLVATRAKKTVKIPPSKIRPAPIRHKQLSDDLVSRIRLIRANLLGIDTHSMEYWLDSFRRDTRPSKEVLVWERICAALWEYLSMTRVKRELFGNVLNVTLGLSLGALNCVEIN